MAVRLSIILFLFLPVFAQAQLKSDFVGICTFDDFTNTTGDNYRGDILNFIDRYNLGVSTKNIQIGDEIVDGSGDVFEVLTIHSTASNFEADVTVQARVSASGAPTGSGQVYRPSANGIIPPGSVDNLGLSNVTKGLIDMHNALRLDSLLGTVANGDSIIAVSFGNDSLSITMESDTVYTAIIPVDSLHQLQADSISALYDSLGVKVDTIIAGNNINITYANGQYTISAPDPNVGTDDQTAGEVWYNDSYLPLNVNDVQQAIDSLKRDLDAVNSGASDGVATTGALDVGNEEIDVTVAAPGTGFSIDISGIETLSSFSGWDMDASDDFSGAWGDLTSVPAGFADNVDDVDDADASATNEGSLTVGAGTASTALINSNTSGSTGVTIEANTGIGITENVGTGTIFIENTGDLDATNELDLIGFTGDVGSAQQIGDGEFLDLEGGYGVVTTMSTDKANFKVDTSEIATVWALADSLTNSSDDQIAIEVPYTPTGGEITATELQTATQQLENYSMPEIIDVTSGTFNVPVPSGFVSRFPIFNIDMSAASTSTNVNFNHSSSLQSARILYHFTNTSNSGHDLNFPTNFLKIDGTAWDGGTTYTVDSDILMYCYFDGVDFYCETIDGSSSGGGSAFWESATSVVRTVSSSTGEDLVFGSSQLDDSGTSGEDQRFFFDNSKGAFYAGEWTSTEADDANRGFNSVNLTRNAITSAYTSASIGGEGNDIDGSGSVAVACDDCIADGSSSNSVLTGKDARSTLENDHVHGGGGDLNLGHHQYRRLVAWKDHTGTGTAVMHLNGTNADLEIPNNTVWGGQCECTAIVKTGGTGTSVGDHKFYQGRFAAKNIAGSTSVQFINTTDSLLDSPSFGSSSLSLLADDTNDALTILINSVPGSVTSITHITCTVHITETGY